jgi:hypothetical protein
VVSWQVQDHRGFFRIFLGGFSEAILIKPLAAIGPL